MNPSTLRVRVARKADEATDICTFELVSVDGRPLPAFSAGSHIDVELPGGVTRQYSLCNDPGESHRYLIGVLKDAAGRGGSKAMLMAVLPAGSKLLPQCRAAHLRPPCARWRNRR